jgi:hypothetical protein
MSIANYLMDVLITAKFLVFIEGRWGEITGQNSQLLYGFFLTKDRQTAK